MAKLRDVLVALSIAAALETVLLNLFAPHLLLADRFSRSILRFFLINASLFTIWRIWIYPFFFSPLRKLPGPKSGNILWGHGPAEFIKKPPGSDFLTWSTSIPNGGLLYFRGFFNNDRLLVTSTETLKAVIGDNAYDYEKPAPVRSFLLQILGAGLILVEGDEHRFQRKHLLPAFQNKQIKDLYPVFWGKGRGLLEAVGEELREGGAGSGSGFEGGTGGGDGGSGGANATARTGASGVVEFGEWATRVTVDIIGLAGMGRDFNTLKNSDDVLVQNYNSLLEPSRANALYFASNLVFPQWFIRALPWHKNKDLARTTGNLHRYCIDLVHERQAEMKSGRAMDKMDILTLLIRSNDFKDEELADQMLTFLAAGHETTSSALTWLTYLLSLHPTIQSSLRHEIRTHLPSPSTFSSSSPSSTSSPTASDIDALPLLNAVCNETLRLYPTVPVTIREAIRPTTIPYRSTPSTSASGTTDGAGTGSGASEYGDRLYAPIATGTRILLSPWAINRSPDIWGEDASQFKPERWLGTDGTGDGVAGKTGGLSGSGSNYGFLTFLHGARSCIGQGFARAELKVLAAAVCGRFEMRLEGGDREVEPAGVITTKPRGGMRLMLREVEGW